MEPAWLRRPTRLAWDEDAGPPPQRTVEVWRIDLDDAGHDPARLAERISEAERERAARFRFERDRRRHVISHAALRSILGRRLGVDPLALELRELTGGKPCLAGPGPGPFPAFNLTHAGQLALLAVGPADHGDGLGVDTEEAARPRIDEALLQGSLSTTERAVWDGLPEGLRSLWFFALWTRKEAAIKADGRGLGIDPTTLEAFAGQGSPWEWGAFDVPDGAGHGVLTFVPRKGYVASLATLPGPHPVRGRLWAPGEPASSPHRAP